MMNLRSLDDIKSEVERLAAVLGAPANTLPAFGRPGYDAQPHIEVNSAGYQFVVVEHGQEILRESTLELDELLYRIFAGITFDLAGRYELTHRQANQDFRRLLFKKQVELLALLSPPWGERCMREQAGILERHPFDDASDARVNLAKELQSKGQTADQAWTAACSVYPLPEAERSHR
jgi:hypothetical protein